MTVKELKELLDGYSGDMIVCYLDFESMWLFEIDVVRLAHENILDNESRLVVEVE